MAINISNNLNRIHNSQAESIRRISTGLKINSAKDNPSAYQIYHSMSAKVRATAQSTQNVQTGNALLATAQGSVSSTVDVLKGMKENLINAANGTNSPSDIQALKQRLDQSVKAIDDNAASQFNGKNLTDGSLGDLVLAGTNGTYNLSVGDMTAKGLGLIDDDGNSTLDLSSPDGISAAIDTVDAALQTALSQQSEIGAVQQGLTYTEANYTTETENLYGSMSTIADADIAKESMQLNSSNTLEQANLFMMSQMFKNNANVLSLLN